MCIYVAIATDIPIGRLLYNLASYISIDLSALLSRWKQSSTNLETNSEIADHDKGDDGSSVLPVRQDAFMQASRPKTKSVSVTVRVKGKDKGNLGACMIPNNSILCILHMQPLKLKSHQSKPL